jgi:Flp pilus assembly CpaE family ATPase
MELARTLWDYIIVDLPPGWSDLHANMFAKSEMAIIVANPNLASFQSASLLMGMNHILRKTLTKPHIVLNRIHKNDENNLRVDDFLRISNGLPVHQFKEDGSMFVDAEEKGKVPMELINHGDFAKSFSGLVTKLTGKPQKEPKDAQKKWKLRPKFL